MPTKPMHRAKCVPAGGFSKSDPVSFTFIFVFSFADSQLALFGKSERLLNPVSFIS
jgi:hypothetical protein